LDILKARQQSGSSRQSQLILGSQKLSAFRILWSTFQSQVSDLLRFQSCWNSPYVAFTCSGGLSASLNVSATLYTRQAVSLQLLSSVVTAGNITVFVNASSNAIQFPEGQSLVISSGQSVGRLLMIAPNTAQQVTITLSVAVTNNPRFAGVLPIPSSMVLVVGKLSDPTFLVVIVPRVCMIEHFDIAECPVNTWSSQDGACNDCRANTESKQGSTSPLNCTCASSYFGPQGGPCSGLLAHCLRCIKKFSLSSVFSLQRSHYQLQAAYKWKQAV
jgi:hypothetical protein